MFTVFINQRFSIHKTLSSQRDEIQREVFWPLFEVFDSTNKQDKQNSAFAPFPDFVFQAEKISITEGEMFIIVIQFSNCNQSIIFNEVDFSKLVNAPEIQSE